MNPQRTILAFKAKNGRQADSLKSEHRLLMGSISTLSERIGAFRRELQRWSSELRLQPPDFQLTGSSSLPENITQRRVGNRLRIVIDFSCEADLGNFSRLSDCSHLIRIQVSDEFGSLPFKGNNGLFLRMPASQRAFKNLIYDTCIDILTAHTLPRTCHLARSPQQSGAELSALKLEFAKRSGLPFYSSDIDFLGSDASSFSFAYACRPNGLESDPSDFDLDTYKELWDTFCAHLLSQEAQEKPKLIDLPYNQLFADWISSDEEFVQKMVKSWGGFREFGTLDDVMDAILSIPHIAGQISKRELRKCLLDVTEHFNNAEDLAFYMSYRRPVEKSERKRIYLFFKKTDWTQKMIHAAPFRETMRNSFQSPYVIMLPFRKTLPSQ